MKVRFYHSDKPRERLLADAFLEGVKAHGDGIDKRALGTEFTDDCEVAVMVGVKSRDLFYQHARAGIHLIYIDKGYTRHSRAGALRTWEYWRVAVDAHQPTKNYRPDYPSDRAAEFGWECKPWRESGKHILLAGSSGKYHAFYDIKEPTDWMRKVAKELRRSTTRPLLYRPKPSWHDAVPIKGTDYSGAGQCIDDALKGAHALVTHGSNACFEAVTSGVPCIILGDAVAKPLSSTDLAEIENPRLASEAERAAWLNFLSYQQWTMGEFASGQAWKTIRPMIYG